MQFPGKHRFPALILLVAVACGGGGGELALTIERIIDTSGGEIVLGDVVEFEGDGFDLVRQVRVGGRRAPILEQRADRLRIQIPGGCPSGVVDVLFSGNGGSKRDMLEVRRLAVLLSDDYNGTATDRCYVIETTGHSKVYEITVAQGGVSGPRPIGFANHGSLALVPLGNANIMWIDMTSGVSGVFANNLPSGPEYLGFSVSPDDSEVLVADHAAGYLLSYRIEESVPPYAQPIRNASGGARSIAGAHFRSPQMLSADDALIIDSERDLLVRIDSTNTIFADEAGSAPTGSFPTEIALFDDDRRAIVTSVSGSGGARLFDAPAWTQSAIYDGGFTTVAVAVAPGSTGPAYLLGRSTNNIDVVDLGATDATRSQLRTLDRLSIYNAIARDPEGRFLYVGGRNGVSLLDLLDDGRIDEPAETALTGPGFNWRDVVGIAIQP